MTQVKKLDFSGTTIFCGIDVHKKNWRVNIQDGEFELEDFSQNADAVLLHKHLKGKYRGAAFKLCYEAGYSGFSAQRLLSEQGLDCRVMNAADVATSDKEKAMGNGRLDN
jgi:transposase